MDEQAGRGTSRAYLKQPPKTQYARAVAVTTTKNATPPAEAFAARHDRALLLQADKETSVND